MSGSCGCCPLSVPYNCSRCTGGPPCPRLYCSRICAGQCDFCKTLMPIALDVGEVHSQIPWISSLGLKAGVLADTLAILMTNLVAWISFLIMVYSTGYMHGDKDLTRYWFLMLFFIGSMQLIALSDNLLMVFFGWEGVGLASYALIGFWYYDRKKDYVGVEGQIAGGIPMWASPTHAGMKAFLDDPRK